MAKQDKDKPPEQDNLNLSDTEKKNILDEAIQADQKNVIAGTTMKVVTH